MDREPEGRQGARAGAADPRGDRGADWSTTTRIYKKQALELLAKLDK